MSADFDVESAYRSHGHIVLRRARAILGTEVDAREALQEVFVSLIDHPGQYAGGSSLTTFLYRMTTNMCLNKLRNQKTRARLLEREGAARSGQTSQDPSVRVSAVALLAQLSPKLQRVAIYYYVDEMSQDEIAGIIGCSRRNVGKLLAKVNARASEVAA